jgi:hypothetical protein
MMPVVASSAEELEEDASEEPVPTPEPASHARSRLFQRRRMTIPVHVEAEEATLGPRP